MPLISIIIPTYNRAELLELTISSVLKQTFDDYEIIVVDDGSTDNTEEKIIKVNCDKIIYLKMKHSGIQAVARNFGLKVAKGEYIAFIDSDDIWFPQKLEKQIEYFIKNPEYKMICSNAYILRNNVETNEFYIKEKFNDISIFLLLKHNIIINSSVLIKREIINQLGYLCESLKLKSLEDYDYWLKVASVCKIGFINEALLYYRIHENNISKNIYQTLYGLSICYKNVMFRQPFINKIFIFSSYYYLKFLIKSTRVKYFSKFH